MAERAVKPCVVCGRDIQWRKKWERDWEGVKYCSEACRKRKDAPADALLERAILELLRRRAGGASICPSEAARTVGGPAWRDLIEPARMAARRLVAEGLVVLTQEGREVDPSRAKGAVRIRLR